MTVHDDLAGWDRAEALLDTNKKLQARAEAAEAENARLEQLVNDWDDLATVLRSRAEAAEAENAHLRDGLREIEQTAAGEADDALVRFVQRLLSSEDGAA